jgi:hypothetical protein
VPGRLIDGDVADADATDLSFSARSSPQLAGEITTPSARRLWSASSRRFTTSI